MTTSDPYGSPGSPGAADTPGTDPSGTSGSGSFGTPSAASGPAASPAAPSRSTAAPVPPRQGRGRSARHTGRVIGFGLAAALLVFVTVILVLFVLFNTQTVDVSLVFGTVRLPLVVALVLAAVLGGLIVGLTALAARARRSSR